MEKSERLNVYMTKDMKQRVANKADEMGVNMSVLFTIAMNEYLKQEEAITMVDIFKQLQKEGKL